MAHSLSPLLAGSKAKTTWQRTVAQALVARKQEEKGGAGERTDPFGSCLGVPSPARPYLLTAHAAMNSSVGGSTSESRVPTVQSPSTHISLLSFSWKSHCHLVTQGWLLSLSERLCITLSESCRASSLDLVQGHQNLNISPSQAGIDEFCQILCATSSSPLCRFLPIPVNCRCRRVAQLHCTADALVIPGPSKGLLCTDCTWTET